MVYNCLASTCRATPDAELAISGHTDSTGSQEYNQGLSHRRVQSAAKYLVQKFGIDPARIILNWYGKSHPVASNSTEDGRALNRRIEGFIFGM